MDDRTPTFDYFPRGMPLVTNDAIEATMHEFLDAGRPPGETLAAMQDEQVRQIRTDSTFREQLREAFQAAGVNLVATTMGGASLSSINDPTAYPETVRRDLARWQAHFDHIEWLQKVTDPEQARHVAADGDVGLIPAIQNAAALGGDLSEIDVLYESGVRIIQLTYNAQNLLGTGCTDISGGGLSAFGRAVIERLNELGVVVDISHCGFRTTIDAIEASRKPVAVTHAFCEAVTEHDRAKSDEELRAVADAGGYVGILALPYFIAAGREEQAYEVFFDHIDHAVSIVGVDRVGIGTDWGTWGRETPNRIQKRMAETYSEMGYSDGHGADLIGETFLGPMERYTEWKEIPKGLADRGYTDDEIQAILGENFLGFWEQAGG